MTTSDPLLHGERVWLRPAAPEDRRPIYEWAVHSDVTASMMGPPQFPDNLPPTWEEFCEDHPLHFFDGPATLQGRAYLIMAGETPAGQIYYNDIEKVAGVRRVELDMWLRAEAFCGKGYGSEALLVLCQFLHRRFGVEQFMVQPSARNRRAIRAYEKIGFTRLPMSVEAAAALWGPNDYHDSVTMVLTVPPPMRQG